MQHGSQRTDWEHQTVRRAAPQQCGCWPYADQEAEDSHQQLSGTLLKNKRHWHLRSTSFKLINLVLPVFSTLHLHHENIVMEGQNRKFGLRFLLSRKDIKAIPATSFQLDWPKWEVPLPLPLMSEGMIWDVTLPSRSWGTDGDWGALEVQPGVHRTSCTSGESHWRNTERAQSAGTRLPWPLPNIQARALPGCRVWLPLVLSL